MSYKVVIVDDHILLSQAIAELVNQFNDFDVIYTCVNGKELLTKLKDDKNIPDVILMDVNMPILNGIETTKIVCTEYPSTPILALSVEEDDKTIIDMLRSGARGYLMKDTKKEVLEEALIEIMNQGYYHTNTVAKLLVDSLSPRNIKIDLKEREVEFMMHACSEKNYKEIAEKMFVSPKTVEGYRDKLYEKLNIKNRIGLVLYAIKNGFFKP